MKMDGMDYPEIFLESANRSRNSISESSDSNDEYRNFLEHVSHLDYMKPNTEPKSASALGCSSNDSRSVENESDNDNENNEGSGMEDTINKQSEVDESSNPEQLTGMETSDSLRDGESCKPNPSSTDSETIASDVIQTAQVLTQISAQSHAPTTSAPTNPILQLLNSEETTNSFASNYYTQFINCAVADNENNLNMEQSRQRQSDQRSVVVLSNNVSQKSSARASSNNSNSALSLEDRIDGKVLLPIDLVVAHNLTPNLASTQSGIHDQINVQLDELSTGSPERFMLSGADAPLAPPPAPIMFQVTKEDGTVQNVNINPVVPASSNEKLPMEGNDPQKQYLCDLCSAGFSSLGNLTRHRMVHTVHSKDDYRYKCPECDRLFLQRCDMKRHQLIHSKSQPYRCQVCDRGYIRQSDLTVHMRFHNRIRSHQCPKCDKAFYQSGDLNRHLRNTHLHAKMLTCGHCYKKYAKEATLIRHMQTSHKDIILQSLEHETEQNNPKDDETQFLPQENQRAEIAEVHQSTNDTSGVSQAASPQGFTKTENG